MESEESEIITIYYITEPLETLTVVLLPRRPHALKDTSFLHGIELFDGVVLLVEVSVRLFPGLCH